MNILFLTDRDSIPQNGGVERVVATLASGFSDKGMQCFLLSSEETSLPDQPQFKKKYHLNREDVYAQLRSIVAENKIDILFSHYMSKHNRRLVLPCITSLKANMHSIRHVALYHSQPGVELMKFPLSVYVKRIINGIGFKENLTYLAKQVLLRLIGRNNFKNFIVAKLRLLYDCSDKLVVLDEAYIKPFNSLIGGTSENKYKAIGNPLSYDDVLDAVPAGKGKTFLVVARMEEETKRLSKVLTFWERVQKTNDDWTLEIIGDGPDRKVYEKMAKSANLRRVSFKGKQKPRSYFEKSSIFLMTSDTEGWPMTILEAMQMGCVPIVFNTFNSASTIVTHSIDGVLVTAGDDDKYIDSMISLMRDDDLRNKMALSAIKDCQKFSKENTVKQWLDLFSSL